MAKMLDLNALDQPILPVKLKDDNQTVFRLTTPTTKLIERLTSIKGEIGDLVNSRDTEKLSKLYDFTAEVISCNADYIKVTGAELEEKYRVTFGDLVIIFSAYLDFINELTSAKN